MRPRSEEGPGQPDRHTGCNRAGSAPGRTFSHLHSAPLGRSWSHHCPSPHLFLRPIQPSSRQATTRPRWGPWIASFSSCCFAWTIVWFPAASLVPVCDRFQFYGGLGRELLVYATAILGG
ncbi:hypothetical protein NDU88_000277 [Pleurodeles waltl]|uniref:Uncharacterized protein n=1 Tax=Pleurodeles waltl TaxID=8319 RepID=A0AAV7UPI0_PLEWA|nr:hypothetical protein NDU88_000277 [Pleurodeles waltl]